MTSVLLVDDDIELSSILVEYFAAEGIQMQTAHDGKSGLQAALEGDHAIVLLDVMLPWMNGVDVLRQLRVHSRLPVMMLTARGDDVDCIVALELGADDYVVKPCAPRKLLARMKALLRRTAPATANTAPLQCGPLTLWPSRRAAEWAGAPINMTATEFNLLETLVRNAGSIVSKQELSQQALGRPLERFDRSIDVHVSSIRQKMPPRLDRGSWIQTVRGMGYLFVLEQ